MSSQPASKSLTNQHDSHVKLFDAIAWEQIHRQNYEHTLRENQSLTLQTCPYGGGRFY